MIGTVENVEAAMENIRAKMVELDKQSEDRKLRSYAVKFEVPLKYHQRLIGPGGSAIQEMSARNQVQITIPRSDNPSETITVTGYEANANACKAEILQLIQDIESMYSQEIHLDIRFHPRLIGQRGRNLRKVGISLHSSLIVLFFRSKTSTELKFVFLAETIQIRLQ